MSFDPDTAIAFCRTVVFATFKNHPCTESLTQACCANLCLGTLSANCHQTKFGCAKLIKSIVISIWAVAISVAVFSIDRLPASEEDDVSVAYEEHTTEPLSVAIFRKGQVIGHFITRIRLELPEEVVAKSPIPLTMIVGDGLHEVAYSMSTKELLSLKESELAKIQTKLTQLLNERRSPLPVRKLRLENTRLLMK